MMYRARTRGRTGHTTGYAAGLGAEMEEVLDLVRESLRRKVRGIEEEAWMYGDDGEGREGGMGGRGWGVGESED